MQDGGRPLAARARSRTLGTALLIRVRTIAGVRHELAREQPRRKVESRSHHSSEVTGTPAARVSRDGDAIAQCKSRTALETNRGDGGCDIRARASIHRRVLLIHAPTHDDTHRAT